MPSRASLSTEQVISVPQLRYAEATFTVATAVAGMGFRSFSKGSANISCRAAWEVRPEDGGSCRDLSLGLVQLPLLLGFEFELFVQSVSPSSERPHFGFQR